ncbi:HEAT repeat domain-containing protein [Nostoc linckia FACHB-104]|nr:HEAT repeat domain-containing protein [Nostoc linckia FACHB-104]
MLIIPRHTNKLSFFFLFSFTLLLTLLLCLPWVSAKEQPEPKAWQINGIVAALDDGHDKIKGYAFDKLGKYDLKDLKSLGKKPEEITQKAANILKDDKIDSSVRGTAAEALGNLGEAAAKYVPDIANILKDDKIDSSVRGTAAEALGEIRQLNLAEVVIVLNYVYEPNQGNFGSDRDNFEFWRFWSYFLGGGTEEVKTLLTWLGRPKTVPDQLTHPEGVKTLKVFRQAWEPSQGLDALRKDLAQQVSEVAANKHIPWKAQDINLLQTHYNNLKKVNFTQANTLQSVINNLEFWQWFFKARNTIVIHIIFWLALIFAYPKFPQVQAIFFWNPWVRRILGVGYVGFLLTWFPPFRRKLFEPFQPSLLADAGLDNFNPQAYFPDSQVKLPHTEEPVAITQVLPNIKGQIVLEGDSGLGKSMFLRHLVKTSPRLVVYLPARKCDNGVIEAIQAKLHGQAQDADFLKNLIYSGALDICIDGLNEVTADTRAKITQFVESYFRGNIIMTTQPLEWTPPSTAKIYKLQPLEQAQIQQFLISRQPRLPKDAKVKGKDYEQACADYLTQTLNNQPSPEELAAVKRILSNPMDLTVVALMLAQGEYPDLFHLQQQQYNLIATEYLQEWKQEFPLKKFSQAVYDMRLNDEQALPGDEFYQVLQSLEDEKYKMVVSRQWQNEEGAAKKEWYFRHDKIMEFFLVQNFLGENEEAEKRLIDHMGDPRFRGVYFLLATLLPLDAAKELREKIIQYAADTKDHTVSDTFVQLLRPRASVN